MPQESRGIVAVEIHKTRISNVNYKKNDKRLLNVYSHKWCFCLSGNALCVCCWVVFFISVVLIVYALDILA